MLGLRMVMLSKSWIFLLKTWWSAKNWMCLPKTGFFCQKTVFSAKSGFFLPKNWIFLPKILIHHKKWKIQISKMLSVLGNLHILEIWIAIFWMYLGICTFWNSGLSLLECIRELTHFGNLDCHFLDALGNLHILEIWIVSFLECVRGFAHFWSSGLSRRSMQSIIRRGRVLIQTLSKKQKCERGAIFWFQSAKIVSGVPDLWQINPNF